MNVGRCDSHGRPVRHSVIGSRLLAWVVRKRFRTASPSILFDNDCGTRSAGAVVMSEITSYRDLLCWQKGMDLVLLVYEITGKYPFEERFGLAAHTRKSAVTVPSNIAEGTRHRLPGYISRVAIALGEHAETETQMLLASRLGYVAQADMQRFDKLSTTVGQLAHGLLRSLEPLI